MQVREEELKRTIDQQMALQRELHQKQVLGLREEIHAKEEAVNQLRECVAA